MRPFREDCWTSSSRQAILEHFILASELNIEFGQFLILRRQGCGFFQNLFSRLSELGNLAL